jgi:hypothetical protein
MRYIKQYEQFVLNEEEGTVKNLIFSMLLSLGLNYADAQTIQQDTVKTDIVKNISDYNKAILFNIYDSKEEPYNKLVKDLSVKMKDPDEFMINYLQLQPDGTLVVKPNFMHGLELHVNTRNQEFGLGYSVKF